VLLHLNDESDDDATTNSAPEGSPRPTSVLTGFASIDLTTPGRDRGPELADDDGLAIFKRRSPGRPAKHSGSHAARGGRDGLTRDGLARDGLVRDSQSSARRDGRGRGAHQAGKRRPPKPEEAIGGYAPAEPGVVPVGRDDVEVEVRVEAQPNGALESTEAQLAPETQSPPDTHEPADPPSVVTADYVAGRVDVFDRTLRAAVAEARLRAEVLSRQVPMLRRLVGAGQAVLLVARCGRLDQPNATDHLMVVTRDRLVVTSQSRSLHRTRVHLNAAVAALLNVRWQPDVGSASVEFAATAIDGVRERFLIEAPDAAAVSHIDAVLGYVFRPAGTRRFNPVEPVMPSWMNPAGAY